MGNEFYIAKQGTTTPLFFGYSWGTGSFVNTGSKFVGSTTKISVAGYSRASISTIYEDATATKVHFMDKYENIFKSEKRDGQYIDVAIPDNTSYISFEIDFYKVHSSNNDSNFEYVTMIEVNPHYKELKKQYTKEAGKAFFRENLEGKITLYGNDYAYIKNASLEDKHMFSIYKNGNKYMECEFRKSGCKFNHSLKNVELKLTPKDDYTNTLNGMQRTFDLLKLSIEKSQVELTKRSVLQLYIAGESLVFNYCGGMYWESEVSEEVSSEETLTEKYFFEKNTRFREVSLAELAVYDVMKAPFIVTDDDIWNNALGASIVFEKTISKGTLWRSDDIVPYRLSDNSSTQYTIDAGYKYAYDCYVIKVYSERNGGGHLLYQSASTYAKDVEFSQMMLSGFRMSLVENNGYGIGVTSTFFLGNNMIEYVVYARLLSDVEEADGKTLQEIPSDDFAATRDNHKYCIGADLFSEDSRMLYLLQSDKTSDSPTPYGKNSSGKYFVAPYKYDMFAYPFLRHSWVDTSLWLFTRYNQSVEKLNLESLMSKYNKKFRQNDFMEIGAIIKSLLEKIDSSIKFESTKEYSEFLYGTASSDSPGKKGQKIFITQKTNVIRGEYDQPAQKAEATLENLLNAMEKCFKCYWYIDEQKRFRIEHISYFNNGLSYSKPEIQANLIEEKDKFNKMPCIYGQNEVAYNTSALNSRFEFAWADESSIGMGGGFSVDIISQYVQQDKVDSVNVELFSADIDYMMLAPEKVSQDGFALVITDSNNKVPIIYEGELYDSDMYIYEPMNAYIQNYYASFLNLFDYYLSDMPAEIIKTSIDDYNYDMPSARYKVKDTKRSMVQDLTFTPTKNITPYKLLRTEIGEGLPSSLSEDIDSCAISVSLEFKPV